MYFLYFLGKAAEAMGMRKIDFITDLGKMDIPHFDFSIEEIMEDVENAHLKNGDLEWL